MTAWVAVPLRTSAPSLSGGIAVLQQFRSSHPSRVGPRQCRLSLTTIAAALVKSGRSAKDFHVVAITSPNMWGDSKKKYLDIDKALVATGVTVTMLPANTEWDEYWRYPPTAASNPLLAEVLAAWASSGSSTSRRFGHVRDPDPNRNFQWLFWHEWVVDGGHLDTTATPPRVRHFLEDALSV
jgi:hypothetical protein